MDVEIINFFPFCYPILIRNPSANAREFKDSGSVPGSERSPGAGNGNPLQCFCLENPMDKEGW